MELCTLIRKRRERKGIARTRFAKMVGISPNSMVKYELFAEEGGKVPGTANLAKMCELLEIDPREAFDVINQRPAESVYDNPFSFVHHLTSDDDFLSMKLSVQNVEDLNDSLDNLMSEIHYLSERLMRIENTVNAMKNGPDQKDPSRFMKSKINTEAVSAASTRKPGGTDEAV